MYRTGNGNRGVRRCNGCQRRCPLSSPRCQKGKNLRARLMRRR